ncbi:interferon-inducible GTPase 5-like [Perca flavescens]|uniref:interferon-inducible GTPase 5-like n=1 Tax=Perca flavescens TaxID=8167 RepID=UPI00106E5265|nr:interferon-inducible GTPase 5-like [Perca flavescens]
MCQEDRLIEECACQHFRENAVTGHRVIPEPSEFHLKQESLTDKACSSPTSFAEVMARRNAALADNHLSCASAKASMGGSAMDNPHDVEIIAAIKEQLETNGPAAAAAKIQTYLDEQDNIQLNIAITGECGSGKSTFVNGFRGIPNSDKERAAPTGVTETTKDVTPYPHPNYPNVTLWDLPGMGTTKFPADEYLKKVEFKRFDFFIIISADRFRENDVKLSEEIQKMGKKFYFVRSKIDHNIYDAKETQGSEFNEEKTLKEIREDCIQDLKGRVESPQVFLVSSCKLHLYDFRLLEKTLEEELPAHKRDALLLALPTVSLEIIIKKKEALQARIKYPAGVSALGAAAPVPGLSVAIDMTMIAATVRQYQVTFGPDSESLQRLAETVRVPLDELRAAMTSPLAGKEITKDLIIKILSSSVAFLSLNVAEEGSRFLPLLGIPVAMTISFLSTYQALNMFLNMFAEDAQKVVEKALGLNTPV